MIPRWLRPPGGGRCLDVSLATAAFGMALHSGLEAARSNSGVGVLYFVLQLQVAVLFAVRRPLLVRSSRPEASVAAVLSTVYVNAYAVAPSEPSLLSHIGLWVEFAGAMLAFTSVLALGRCFGILAAGRGVVTRGPYRIVRHPLYAAYMILDLGFLLDQPSTWNLGVCLFGLLLFVVRLHYEETVLDALPEYPTYRQNVPARLVPLVY